MSDDVEDVRRVLTMAFRSSKRLNPFDLERWLAFDMGWLEPQASEDAVAALLAAGWLRENGPDLEVAVPLGSVEVPLGWFPRPSRLLQPVKATLPEASGIEPARVDTVGSSVATPVANAPPTSSTSTASHSMRSSDMPADPRMRVTQRLVKYIARTSGIDAEELRRRADRKQKAFRHVTPWLALALVAREQNLDMDAIVEALAVV